MISWRNAIKLALPESATIEPAIIRPQEVWRFPSRDL